MGLDGARKRTDGSWGPDFWRAQEELGLGFKDGNRKNLNNSLLTTPTESPLWRGRVREDEGKE